MTKRKGISLIELVLTVALLGIVIQVVYSVFFVGSTSYSVSTNKGFSQQDVRIAADFITKELKTATEVGVNLENKNGFYSLEVEAAGDRNNLVKYYNQLDDKGTTDTTDDEIVKTKISSFSGNWQKIELSNSYSGIILATISQEEGTGKGKSDYNIDFNIDLVNNPTEVNAFVLTDLVAGDVVYYRNEPVNLNANGIYVKPESLDLGDVLRTLTFKDSLDTDYVYKTFTAVSGTPIEKPSPNPTKTGYTFIGWFTALDDSGIEYTSWDAMPDNDFTLYAKWEVEDSSKNPNVTGIKLKKPGDSSYSRLPNTEDTRIEVGNASLQTYWFEITGSNLNVDNLDIKVNSIDPTKGNFDIDSYEFSTKFDIKNKSTLDLLIEINYKGVNIKKYTYYFKN